MAIRPKAAVAIILSFCLTAFAACDNSSAPQKPDISSPSASPTKESPNAQDFGDTLVAESIGDASNLIPFLAADSASAGVADAVFGQLMRLDKNYDLIPGMAEKWDVSADQKTITFHLRKNIKWHDGAHFSADDLLFQYEMMVHPDVPSAYKEDFMQIQKAEAPDDFTFRVTFKEPYAPALVRMAGMTGLPRHLLKGTKPADLIKSPLARNPVGNGAWRFVEWKAQTHIILESNPAHYLGRPMIAKNITRVIPDPATQFLELKSGGIDMMSLQPLQYLKQTDGEYFQKNYRKYKYLANAYTYMGYNMQRPMFADKRVRQAITYAIDKRELIDGVLMGLGQEADVPYKPGTWAYKSDVKKYTYDPAKAAALLKEAGWSQKNSEGYLVKDGKPFEFEIITNQGNPLRAKTAEILQQRLKQVGIKVGVRVLEWSSFINNFINKRNFDACILGWSLGIDPDQYEIWNSKKTGEHELNFISYSNAEVDKILDDARRTFNKEARKKLYHRFQDILADEQPYTFLYVPEALPIVSSRVRGIDPGPAGIAYNFDEWWIPKAGHKRPVITK